MVYRLWRRSLWRVRELVCPLRGHPTAKSRQGEEQLLALLAAHWDNRFRPGHVTPVAGEGFAICCACGKVSVPFRAREL